MKDIIEIFSTQMPESIIKKTKQKPKQYTTVFHLVILCHIKIKKANLIPNRQSKHADNMTGVFNISANLLYLRCWRMLWHSLGTCLGIVGCLLSIVLSPGCTIIWLTAWWSTSRSRNCLTFEKT